MAKIPSSVTSAVRTFDLRPLSKFLHDVCGHVFAFKVTSEQLIRCTSELLHKFQPEKWERESPKPFYMTKCEHRTPQISHNVKWINK